MAKTFRRVMFSDEQKFLLIELYRDSECLWNINSFEYKDSAKRRAALAGIAERLGLSEEITKKKISAIRATYLLEKKKVDDSQRAGPDADIYRPSVPWFEHMKFLDNVIIARKFVPNLDSPTTQDEDSKDKDTELKIETSVSPPMLKKKKYVCADTGLEGGGRDGFLNKLLSTTAAADQDMFDNFGNLIASQLRSIPIDDALQLQTDISEMVNKRLLMVHRKSVSSSWESSGPSISSTSYSDFSEFKSEDIDEF